MRNLLSANFLRVRKNKLFWGLLAVSFSLGVFMSFDHYQMNQHDSFPLDGAFFFYPVMASLLTAVFVPLFFGQEYSDHAIRNKVTSGHLRPAIYAANLLTAAAVSLLFCAAHMAAVVVIGVPLVGPIAMDAGLAALVVLASLITMAAFCALFTFISMTCSRKAVSATLCILGVFSLLIASIYLRSRLEAPEYCRDYSVTESGDVLWGDQVANPQYLRGSQRAVCEFFYNVLPSSQAVQYASQQTQNLFQMPLYSLLIILLSTGAGVLLFRRKDLK